MRRDVQRHNHASGAPGSRRSLGRTAALAAVLFGISRAVLAADDQQNSGDGQDTWHALLRDLDLVAKPAHPPDFVESSRPDPSSLHFIPTGQPHPKRPDPVKTADQVKAAEAKLDAARTQQLNPTPPAPTPKKATGLKPVKPAP